MDAETSFNPTGRHHSPPDVVFVAEARRGIVTQINIFGAPDLVVEILSPSTEKRDRVMKQQLYGKLGVQELWLVEQRQGPSRSSGAKMGAWRRLRWSLERER